MVEVFIYKDLDAVMEIWLQANLSAHGFIPQSYWQQQYEAVRQQIPGAELYVFREHGCVKGFIGLTERQYIAGLFVAPRWQAEGIGRRLLTHCQDLYPHLELDVYMQNIRAVSFYCKNGFTVVQKKENDETGCTEYRMAWDAAQL